MKAISRRSFLGGAASAAILAGLAACGNNAAGSGSADGARKGNVYWLNFKPELDDTAQALGKKYMEKYPDVKVKVVTAAAGTYEQTLTSEMDKDEAPTLFVIGNRAAVKEWGGYAMDLKDTDLVKAQSTDEYNLKDGDKVVAAGYCYECYGICVNDELLEQAGHSKEEIKDFATLKTVVEDIHNRAAELGFDAFVATDLDNASSWRITGHLANLEYFYEEKKAGSTWTECPKTITGEYLPNYKNLFDLAIKNSLVSPDSLATGGHDPATQFAQGKAAFMFSGSFGYADIKDTVKKTSCIPYYCGVAGEEKAGLNCGTENCWAVNANASDQDKKATLDFALWLVTDPEAAKAMVEELGVLPFTGSPEGTNPYLNDAANLSSKGNYTMDWATNFQPNVETYRAALVSALNAYTGDLSDANWDAFKTAFVDGWANNYGKTSA